MYVFNFQRVQLAAKNADRFNCSFMHGSEEKTFLALQIRIGAPIIWAKFSFV